MNWISWLVSFVLRDFGIGQKAATITPETKEIETLASSNATAQTQLAQEKTNDASIVDQKAAVAAADRSITADTAGVRVDPEASGSAGILSDDGGRRD